MLLKIIYYKLSNKTPLKFEDRYILKSLNIIIRVKDLNRLYKEKVNNLLRLSNIKRL